MELEKTTENEFQVSRIDWFVRRVIGLTRWIIGEDMPQVRFTQNIQRHIACPSRAVEGSTLREVLEAYFAGNPPARGYVLDDQGALRKHMAIFINGEPVLDRKELADPVPPDGTVEIVQALSGG